MVAERYPGLGENEFYWKLMQFLLFSTEREKHTGRLIMKFTTVLQLAGAKNRRINGKTVSANEMLGEFESNVGIKLNIRGYGFAEGKARTALPEIDPDILDVLIRERIPPYRDGKETVYFHSGCVPSRRSLQKDRDAYLSRVAEEVDYDHPAYELLQFLNSQGMRVPKRVLAANLPKVRHAIDHSTEYSDDKKLWAFNVLRISESNGRITYQPSRRNRTVRVFPISATVIALPRKMRKLALSGCYSMDLKYAQLAIAAAQWDLKCTKKFLAEGREIWEELLTYSGLEISKKPVVKRLLYATVFGMAEQNLVHGYAEEDESLDISTRKKLLNHPIIRELLDERNKQMQIVRDAGGTLDAFGRWISIPYDNKRGYNRANAKSVLAQVAQSYELKIMLAVLPILKKHKDVYVMAWLHDGITLHLGNRTKSERRIRQIKKAIDEAATSLNIPTTLEVELLCEADSSGS